jgi:Tol biopolymer transport system component
LTGTAATSDPFAIVGGSPFNLGVGQSVDIEVSFTPSSDRQIFSGTVTFESNGGSVSLPVSGTGTPASVVLRQLTTGPGFFSTPSTSTDGTRVTFRNQFSFLSVMNSDGQNLRTFPFGGFAPRISGNGVRIIFASERDLTGENADRNYEIFAIDADGSNVVQLTHSLGVNSPFIPDNRNPSIDESGAGVVFESRGDLTGENPDQNWEVFVIRSDGTGLRQVTNVTGTQDVDPVPQLSPDGARIVFRSNLDLTGDDPVDRVRIYIVNTDGTNLRRVTLGDIPSVGGPPYVIAFVAPNGMINVISSDGTGLRELTSRAFPAFGGERPSISADNSRVIFVSRANHTGENAAGNFQLFLVQADGTGLRQITRPTQDFVEASWPSISGDGTMIAFEWRDPRFLPQIFIAEVVR